MAIKALFFDFDGVIIETEMPAYQSWQEIYGEFGVALSVHEWASCLGTVGGFNPIEHLEELTGTSIEDPDALIERRWKRKMELLAEEDLRPGVDDYLRRAAELNLQVAIVSSDTDEWINDNLTRVGRREGWHHINCANDDTDRAKPSPCLYEEALASLELEPSEAIVFEDSPNGIKAAKSAGLYCVAVSNPVTKSLDLTLADMHLDSMSDVSLDDVLARAGKGRA